MPSHLDNNFAPIFTETDVTDLPVSGALPPGLEGALLRNGPNPQFPIDHPGAHWFTGDGMLHAIRLLEGRASYSNRWIRTPKFLAERAAGRALYAGFAGAIDPAAPQGTLYGGVANTSVVWHGGRLLALEEAHVPLEIDPATLGTRTYCDFGGVAQPFTAHPKLDAQTGEMVFFGYHVDGPLGAGLSWGVVDREGQLLRQEAFQAPYASMVHDFMVTPGHVMFPILPLTASLARAMQGQPPYLWEPAVGGHVGVMRRDTGAASLRWFRAEACFVFHVMNAWEEGETLYADVMQYAAPPLFPHAPDAPKPERTGARPVRWKLDLSGGTDRVDMTDLDEVEGEFPRIDDRVAGLANRHGWFAQSRSEAGGGIAHIDLAQGRRRLWALPEGDGISEPVFVPRGESEGDGWILAVAWRGEEAASDLVVLDALSVADGPVATVRLPNRVPVGFHGAWVPAA